MDVERAVASVFEEAIDTMGRQVREGDTDQPGGVQILYCGKVVARREVFGR